VLRRVNEILGDHNVDKQMTDSKGDTAYLMADISDVKERQIATLYKDLEGLKGMSVSLKYLDMFTDAGTERIITRILY